MQEVFFTLGCTQQPDDLFKHGFRAERDNAVTQDAVRVHRPARNAVARGLVHRHGFARQHRLVHAALAAHDNAVGGDAFSRPGDHNVAPAQSANFDNLFRAAAFHARCLGLEMSQGVQGR